MMSRDEFETLLTEPFLTNFASGTRYASSNLSYTLLRHVVELTTGQSFLNVATANMLRRVGMTESYLDVAQVPEGS